MQNRLKPMTAKDILDVTFSIARERFWTLQGVIFFSFLPAAIILLGGLIYFGGVLMTNFAGLFRTNPETILQEISSGFGFLPILVLIGLFLLMIVAIISGTMLNTYGNIRVFKYGLHQEHCTVKEAFRGMKTKWLRYFVAGILISVLLAVVIIPLSILTGMISVKGSFTLQLICQLVTPILQIGANFLICLTPVVIALEDTNAIKAIARAFTLLSHHRLRVFGILVLTYLLAYALFVIMFGILAIPIALAIAYKQSIFIVVTLFSAAGALMMLNIMIAFAYGPLTAIYYDLIIRKEGYDLQLQLKAGTTLNATAATVNERSRDV
jgi:hypothetical protein